MRRVFALLALAACTNDPRPPTVEPPKVRSCTPESEGFGALASLEQAPFSLPPGCRVLEEDGRTALFRRQVTRIEDATELSAACAGPATVPDGGPASYDGGAEAPPIDFGASALLVIRIPDTTLPRWSLVEADGSILLGESSAICTGIDPKPVRYMRLVPKTATVAFHLCEPEACEGDEG